MKPNFALSLSFDGIRMLHRAAGGWRLVGEVALDADDLPGDLARLREKALALEPGGLRSKLLLPNAQIRYLTIDTPGMDTDARREASRDALDGSTPYPVSDLVFDISADGDRTHVAAVARETLQEAEAFAVEYRFDPVSFAAVPGDQNYLGEPYFGQTAGAAELLGGATVEPDGVAVVVIGKAQPPERLQEDSAAVPPMPMAAPAPPLPEPEAKPEPEPVKEPQPASTKEQAEETAPPPSAPEAEASAEEEPLPSMPTLGGARREGPKQGPKAPDPTAEPKAPPAAPAAFATRRARQEPPAPTRPAPSVSASYAEVDDLPDDYEPLDPPSPLIDPRPSTDAPNAARTGFLSRRKPKSPRFATPPRAPKQARPDRKLAAAAVADPAAGAAAFQSEADRMTIFGARRGEVGGKPRFLGLMLTAALLLFLAGVAAWAAVFLEEDLSLSRLFGSQSEPEVAFSDPVPDTPILPAPVEPEVVDTRTASLDPTLSPEDSAVLEALQRPVEPAPPEVLSEAALEAKYAATGIWSRAPEVPDTPADLVTLDDLYVTGIDPVSTAKDAVALPGTGEFETDLVFAALPSPAAPGTSFAFDDRGLVRPSAEGTLSPDGILVYLGRPAVVPPVTPTRFETSPEEETTSQSRLAAFRPKDRPQGLVQSYERGQFGGLTRDELAEQRPVLRPQSLQERAAEIAEAAEPDPINTDDAVAAALATPAAFDNPTQLAATASRRPDTRPNNFSRIVRRAEKAQAAEPVRVASAASVAPRAVQPKIPSKSSVSKAATVSNAINLRKVNLIGVYGKPSARRALVRLDNGRYQKVVVGDRLDGGRVSAIGESELRYRKGSRNLILKMP